MKTNLRAIVNVCAESGHVVLCTEHHFNPTSTGISEATQDTYKAGILAVAAELGCTVFNVTDLPLFANYATANAAGYMDADGLHATGAGYTYLAAGIRRVIDVASKTPIAVLAGVM
jgi:hypothetical protein